MHMTVYVNMTVKHTLKKLKLNVSRGILNSLNIPRLREENHFGITKCNYMYLSPVILPG